MTGNGDRGAASGVPALPAEAPRPASHRPLTTDNAGERAPLLGYRGPSACAAAGITYRQLDYWARTGLVEPSIRPGHGSGTQRLYGFRDILVLKIVKRLLDAGVSLQSIRAAVRALRTEELASLSGATLLSDGAAVYRCSSAEEVAALLRNGRGLFGIAVGAVWTDVEEALAQLQAETVSSGETVIPDHPGDELARRRKRG
ncbi:MerR family transcriptional regulator [Streptomyces otsuchiensis]|uniref:MerR family transcriptional regulator n=1 Tax=Streptomyces otsuchiensis TaxID=2681388 RepID=UPI0027D98D70|nr:MerR family transcriptional regulator [Streptomyces otsuchiensis]